MQLGLSLSLSNAATLNKGGGVSPITILGDDLLAWWTADDAASMTLVGSAVSSWRDKKNGYEITQTLSAARPVFSATGFGGAPGLTFDGVDDRLSAESIFGFPSAANGSEIWAVVQQDAAIADTGDRVIIGYGEGTNATRRVGRAVQSSANRVRTWTGTGSATVAVTELTVAMNSRHVVRSQYTPTTLEVAIDEVAAVGAAAVPATTTTRTRIGSTPASVAGAFWHGHMRDVLVTRPLTTAKADALEAYLLARRAL